MTLTASWAVVAGVIGPSGAACPIAQRAGAARGSQPHGPGDDADLGGDDEADRRRDAAQERAGDGRDPGDGQRDEPGEQTEEELAADSGPGDGVRETVSEQDAQDEETHDEQGVQDDQPPPYTASFAAAVWARLTGRAKRPTTVPSANSRANNQARTVPKPRSPLTR